VKTYKFILYGLVKLNYNCVKTQRHSIISSYCSSWHHG